MASLMHQAQSYPYYNAKLESLTHRMPNLSFDSLAHQPQPVSLFFFSATPTAHRFPMLGS